MVIELGRRSSERHVVDVWQEIQDSNSQTIQIVIMMLLDRKDSLIAHVSAFQASVWDYPLKGTATPVCGRSWCRGEVGWLSSHRSMDSHHHTFP